MFTQIKDDLSVYFLGAIILAGVLKPVYTVDVRLRDGQAENQGRVEVRRQANETWGKVCDLNFRDNEAAVVCKQLNYKYSRKDEKVYITSYPDFRLENFECNGSENNFSECIKDEWKTGFGKCDVKVNAYASVCCSNSPIFGEMRDGIFVSHCSDTWIDAEESCEEKKATLANLKEYNDIIGSVHKPKFDEDITKKGYWTKSFFTPWMWSNGCFEFSADTFEYEEFNLENNTAQACLQMCSIDTEPSSFLLSGNICRCLPTQSSKSSISEVLPGKCNKTCLGDSTFFCGSGLSGRDSYWSLYTIASEDIFYKISDPQTNQRKQCAILDYSKKLSSENCYKNVGYICGQFLRDNTTIPKLMYFQNSAFYKIVMQKARKKCKSHDVSMRLIGEHILKQDIVFTEEFDNLWVDISRVLAEAYTINWEPKNKRKTSLWRNLEPKWCLATRQRDANFADEITACHTRFRYICSIYNKKGQSSMENGSSSQNSTDTGSQAAIILAVICGLLVVGIIILTVFLYMRRRRKRKQREQADDHCQSQCSLSPQNDYDASLQVNLSEHIYAELKPTSDNIYSEVDALISNTDKTKRAKDVANDANNENKEPVTMKRSYSSPKDMQTLIEDNPEFKDPSYIYPYDKVHRSDTNEIPGSEKEEEILEEEEKIPEKGEEIPEKVERIPEKMEKIPEKEEQTPEKVENNITDSGSKNTVV